MARDLAHLSDEAVVALAARSDDSALAELYDRFGRVVYGLALRMLRDRGARGGRRAGSVPRRLAQRAPVHARAREGVDVDPDARRTAARSTSSVARSGAARTRSSSRRSPSATPTDENAWLRLERERVQSALKQLPDPQREALELAYYGGFTQSELAERLGQPVGTIKSRMFTGLARLRELLGEAEEMAWSH